MHQHAVSDRAPVRVLPGLRPDRLAEVTGAFREALRTAVDPDVRGLDRVAAQGALHRVLEWLWDVAAAPVLSALGLDAPHTSAAPWPRVWWIAGGPLSQLPLHAAGHHRERSGRTVLDCVVSSHTPTVRALHHARRPRLVPPSDARALVVAMPTTPHQPPLPQAAAEAALLRARLPRAEVLGDGGSRPSRSEVLSSLPGHSIVHFACHALSDPADPSLSRLLLHDHATAPLTVASLAPVDLERAELAYLSACSTASTSAPALLDEGIHLAMAFQLAGFRHVVSTLWEIDDAVALSVVDTFYTALRTESGTLDTDRSAQALHSAVRALRDRRLATPSLWASYLHAGT
ncbi:CHAT domain-containing protein [Streptomyces sp. NPDC056501]|uniref:CHAT domain-containing protein n=1 Tax=Streptomyces sp. NPDC056501 TaxID=3345841 RepID=UPI0036AC9BBD